MVKKKQSKTSKIKKDNKKRTKLVRQGKLKVRRHQSKKLLPVKALPPKKENVEEDEESDHGEDMMNMVEKDDLEFLKSAISKKSYDLLKKIRLNDSDDRKTKRKKRKQDDDTLEEQYQELVEKMNDDDDNSKKTRLLLPVKTKDGIIKKRIIEEEIKEENEDDENKENNENKEYNSDDDDADSDHEILKDSIVENKVLENSKPISTVELLACRDEVLKSRKIKIGLLSSSLLENPEMKVKNFKPLLELMDENNPEVYITVRKLATVSLLEVFKDILPSYNIVDTKQEGVKYKKDTYQLQNYEASLLKHYKIYLQKLEKLSSKLRKKRGDNRIIPEPEIELAMLAINSMCDLLTTHPYFNFSTNIANFLLPYLDNKRIDVRQIVFNGFSQIFKDDKKGELTFFIIKKLNQYIKSRGHSVHTEIITVLLSLRIKDVNLDKEREEEAKQKKLMNHKQRILALSKKERKRNKKLKEVENELLETKAEENKMKKQKTLTDITSLVFTIYFRILKQAPNSKVLSACLEGLAKFAHCINLEFYQDLVNVIDHLMAEGNLGQREQLNCILTVFTILSGQGSALNIDPHRFYVHMYKILLNINIVKNQENCEILIKSLVHMLVTRRKRITQNRLTAFVKRIATLALQLEHHGALALLGIIKTIYQLCKTADILLDTDSTTGDGSYQPELDEPEYCNAQSTALWELIPLQKHFHSVVQKISNNIANGVPTSGKGSLTPEISKLSPEELYNEYNPTGVAFNPAIPPPSKKPAKTKPLIHHHFTSGEFEDYLKKIKKTPLTTKSFDFFYDCKKHC